MARILIDGRRLEELMDALPSAELPFQHAWIAFLSPPFQPVPRIAHAQLPPLPYQDARAPFVWLYSITPPLHREQLPEDYRHDALQAMRTQFQSLPPAVAAANLTLPPDFWAFMQHPDILQHTTTGLVFTASSALIASPVFPGWYFVRFLRIRGSNLTWYLAMKTADERSIVASGYNLDVTNPLERWSTSGE